MDGVNIVGVQFRRAGRIYDFATGSLNLRVGDDVVVDTDRGPSLAKVATVDYRDRAEYKEKGLKDIVRMASLKDLEDTRKLTPEHSVEFARKRVEELKLKMTVLQAEVQFGGNKVIVFFSAPGRVDFRELVKELATGLKARVELKQVGARDEAKLVGGLGICGREYCCSSFLRDFVPVSIKMAKNQNLALNPTKVSGGCGRLLCCLTYENDLYTEMRKELPPKGTRVRVIEDNSYGHVIKGDVLNQRLLIDFDVGRWAEAPLSGIEIVDANAGRGASETVAESPGESEADIWAADLDMEALTESSTNRGSQTQERSPRESGDREPSRSSDPKLSSSKPDDQGQQSQQAEPSSQSGEGSDDSKQKSRRRGRRGNRNKKSKPPQS